MKLHHLRVSCMDVSEAKQKFLTLYSFKPYGYFEGKNGSKTEVVKHGDIFILLKKAENYKADSIDDIAFCVSSLNSICNKVTLSGNTVIKTPYVENCKLFAGKCKPCPNCLLDGLKPCSNSIEKAIIKSPVGNLQHTLIRKCEGYSGNFLPGCVQYDSCVENHYRKMFNCIDHIAIAVPCNQTIKHTLWYKKCLDLFKFNCNKLEKDNGLVIKANKGQGLRLFTLAVHPCSEESVTTEEQEVGNGSVKFVFCESLTQEGTDQVQNFLNRHHGPGVQHVAFKSTSIIEDTQIWFKNGVEFLSPPAEYYKIIENTLRKLADESEEEDLTSSVKDLGILVDVEKISNTVGESKDGYLYQVFTSPVFASNTFFFELVQRENSVGFGSGNVRALWNAVDISLNGIR